MSPRAKRHKVVIVGGGVAGLTAAHELVERDFDVVVYERRDRLGGKAASTRHPTPSGSAAGAKVPARAVENGVGTNGHSAVAFPGEHGFRFFPGWYRHLPDTMRRTPVRGRRDHHKERSVHDHLVPTERNLLVRYERDPVPLLLYSPRNVDQARTLLEFIRRMASMGLAAGDVAAFFRRLADFVRSPERTRELEFDAISWWNFVDAERRSDAFRMLTVATTRTLLAAKAEEASAYTIALLAIRTLFDSPLRSDSVLDGPASEVWIEPWVRYLKGRGVTFHLHHELESVNFDGTSPLIGSLTFLDTEHEVERRQWKTGLRAGDPEPAAEALAKLPPPESKVVEADFYVFALPVEQMAYYVHRSATLTSYAPALRNIVALCTSIDWMSGIQYYFKYPVELGRGHIVCADSEWALTAVEQTQFWTDVALPENVQSVLSVDVSAWDKKGRFIRKEAYACTRAEIAREVWEQLKASFNRVGESPILRDDALLAGRVEGSYHLDDDIVERYDRKKHAAYVAGADRALRRAAATAAGAAELLDAAQENPDAPFVFGDRLEMNVEPLLVNRPGYLGRRPHPRTAIANMFLAADYVKTSTNLACMEGANEAARLAVNAILEAATSKYAPCKTWRLQDGELLAQIMAVLGVVERWPAAGAPLEVANQAMTTLGTIATRAADNLKQLWKRP